MDRKYIMVGQIINTHGVKGELKINPLTDNIKRFERLEKIYLGNDKKELGISGVKYVKNFVVLKFKEFDNINDVIKYKKEYIYIDYEDRIDLPKDHFFIFDLIGCKVFDLENRYVGEVKDVITYTSNDVYIIYNDETDNEVLIPARKEFIKKIDVKSKKILIDPIEGMIEWL